MRLYEDTRQQKGKHGNIEKYCKQYGIELIRKKLPIGDYSLESAQKRVYIDTKQNLGELGFNLFNKNDKFRFEREIQRAENEHADFIILVEDKTPFDKWVNPRAATCYTYSGKDIQNRLYQLGKKYEHLYLAFCSKDKTAESIIGILTGIMQYEWDEEEFQRQEEWAARVKAAESTQQIKT